MAYGELSKIYDKLIYEDINYTEMNNFIINICKENNIEFLDYLDIACGTGNMTIKLAREFQNIYAVDLSEDMLREAFFKFKEGRINPRLVCQDMTKLDLNHKFNLITCILDSTNYILNEEDLEKYFKKVSEHLKDDGIFIFDINSYYKLTEILGNNTYTYDEEGVFYTWENQLEDNIISMFLTFFIKKQELYERFDEEHEERAYKTEEIERVLHIANLQIVNIFDGYTYENIKKDTERIVFVVKKGRK